MMQMSANTQGMHCVIVGDFLYFEEGAMRCGHNNNEKTTHFESNFWQSAFCNCDVFDDMNNICVHTMVFLALSQNK